MPGPRLSLRDRARAIRRDVLAVWFAARDPRTPWYAKACAVLVAGYVLSPIDLIPDFIPVLGYLDDLVLVPLGVLLVARLVPPHLMDEFRAQAAAEAARPVSRTAAVVIVLLWIIAAVLVIWWLLPLRLW